MNHPGSTALELSGRAVSWRDDMADFLKPEREISGTEQLGLMLEFENEFGRPVPPLSRRQLAAVSEQAEAHPNWRLTPTLHRRVSDRRTAGQLVDNSPLEQLLSPFDEIWVPSKAKSLPNFPAPSKWHKLLDGEAVIYESERIFQRHTAGEALPEPEIKPYGLRSRTPDGRMVNHANYLASLVLNGDALVDNAGNKFTFPFMDISITTPDHEEKRPADLYKRLDYIVTPEACIKLQILHVVADKPIHVDVTYITNEVIGELKPNRHFAASRGFVGVTRAQSASEKFIRVGLWSATSLPDWQLANGVSGLVR